MTMTTKVMVIVSLLLVCDAQPTCTVISRRLMMIMAVSNNSDENDDQ